MAKAQVWSQQRENILVDQEETQITGKKLEHRKETIKLCSSLTSPNSQNTRKIFSNQFSRTFS